jgi:hypothetical protein
VQKDKAETIERDLAGSKKNFIELMIFFNKTIHTDLEPSEYLDFAEILSRNMTRSVNSKLFLTAALARLSIDNRDVLPMFEKAFKASEKINLDKISGDLPVYYLSQTARLFDVLTDSGQTKYNFSIQKSLNINSLF